MRQLKGQDSKAIEDPVAILDRRLASGEIDKREHQELRNALLSDRATPPRRSRAVSRTGFIFALVAGVVIVFAVTSAALAVGPWGQGGTWGMPWGWGGPMGGGHMHDMGDMGGGMMEDDTSGYGPFDVAIVNYAYSPQSVTISSGSTLTWVNMDHVMHTVSFGVHEDDHDGGEALDSGPMYHMDTWSYTFHEPGVYEYHCDPHPYMTGTVVVEG